MKDVRTSIIYAIKNKINGLMYIGSTIELETRWRMHKIYLTAGTHNIKLQKAWNEFGENAFEFIILEKGIPLLARFVAEQHWLDVTESYKEGKGYNISPKAGSYIPITDQSRTKEAIEDINVILNEIKNKTTYRCIAKNFKVSLGFIHQLKIKYLPELVAQDELRKKRTDDELLKKITKRHDKIKKTELIRKLLKQRKTYRQINKETNISIGTISKIYKSSKIDVKISRMFNK